MMRQEGNLLTLSWVEERSARDHITEGREWVGGKEFQLYPEANAGLKQGGVR